MTKIIGFGILGMGHIGKRHAQEINSNPFSELIGYSDPQIHEFQINGSTFYSSSIEELISSKSVDVVNVCTPNGLHAEHALIALNHGKHVIIEKPMTLSTKEAKLLTESAMQNDRKVFCVMQNRYSPVVQWLKSVLDEKVLGEIYNIHIQCAWNRDDRYYKPNHWHGTLELDGGPLYTQFSHFIDVIYWLFGSVEITYTEFFNFNHKHNTEFEDSGRFHFITQQMAQGSFHYTTSVYNKNLESSLQIIAQNGSIQIGGQYMNHVNYCDIKNYVPPSLPESPAPNQYPGYQGSASNHAQVIQNCIDVLNHNQPIDTPISDGFEVVKLIETIYLKRF